MLTGRIAPSNKFSLSTAWEGDLAGAGELENPERLHQFDELLDLAFIARDLDGETVLLHIDNFCAENVCDLHHFGSGLGVYPDLDQHKFTVHVFAVAEIVHFDRVNKLVELFHNLINSGVVPACDNGHPRNSRVLRWGDVERIDVESAPAEKPGHAR